MSKPSEIRDGDVMCPIGGGVGFRWPDKDKGEYIASWCFHYIGTRGRLTPRHGKSSIAKILRRLAGKGEGVREMVKGVWGGEETPVVHVFHRLQFEEGATLRCQGSRGSVAK